MANIEPLICKSTSLVTMPGYTSMKVQYTRFSVREVGAMLISIA